MISICIITKNEIEYLKQNLKLLKKYNVEIVVVDTGSTDGSVDVAREYADIVGCFEWCDDFSKAKNYAISLASNDVIMTLDTDEMIKEFDCESVEKIITANPDYIGRIKCLSPHTVAGEERVAIDRIRRVFNRNNYMYSGRIHEQLVPLKGNKITVVDVPIVVNHLGYYQTEKQRKEKADRNIKLLLEELNNNPDDSYLIYQLGKAYMYAEKYQEALVWFEKDFSKDLNPRLDWVLDLIINSGFLYIESGRVNDALFFESLNNELSYSADYYFMMGNIYMQNAMFEKAITSFEKATTLNEGQIEGNNSYNAFYNIGVIYECTGNADKAAVYYEKCGEFPKAKNGLERLKAKYLLKR